VRCVARIAKEDVSPGADRRESNEIDADPVRIRRFADVRKVPVLLQ
jgi:hypothetical protein